MKNLRKRSEIGKGEKVRRYIDDRSFVNRKVCHGDPGRSYYFRDRPMPLCARCSGLYYSVIPAMIFSVLLYLLFDPSPYILIPIFFITQVPWSIDGFTQFYGLRKSNNLLRFITGTLGGLGWGSILGFAIYLNI